MKLERSTPQVPGVVKQLPLGSGGAVLIVEPNPDKQWRLARLATLKGRRVIGCAGMDGALALLKACPVHTVMVAEEAAPDVPSIVTAVREAQPGCRLVFLTDPSEPISGIRPRVLDEVEFVQRPKSAEDVGRLLAG